MSSEIHRARASAIALLERIGDRDAQDGQNATRRGLRSLITDLGRASERARIDAEVYSGDTSAPDMTRELMSIVNENRAQADAEFAEQTDVDFLDKLRNGGYVEVAKLIGFTAEFADEDAHGLISTAAKTMMSQSGGTFPMPGRQWHWFVSDKLEAHVREVLEIIRVRCPQLRAMKPTDIIRWEEDNFDNARILTAFCRSVATRWRTSAIIAGQQYKSTKMIDTIKQAFLEHLSFFAGVFFEGGRLVVKPPAPPWGGSQWGNGVIDA